MDERLRPGEARPLTPPELEALLREAALEAPEPTPAERE